MADLVASGPMMGTDKIACRIRYGFTMVGTAAFCVYSRSWKDWYHLVYDIPSAIAVFAFLGQLLGEGLVGARTIHLWIRVIFVIPLAAVPAGRDFCGWNISGHLTDVFAIAILQTFDRRLSLPTRIAYWLPLLVVIPIRWFVFDKGDHWQTYNAAIVGIACAGLAVGAMKLSKRKAPGEKK